VASTETDIAVTITLQLQTLAKTHEQEQTANEVCTRNVLKLAEQQCSTISADLTPDNAIAH
jgi:hypothetical protein